MVKLDATNNARSNIPPFPNFKLLELDDRLRIELITQQFEPYSDYNFISLWSYNVKNDIQISKLKDGLVVRFSDYITGEPFYSFLGSLSNSKQLSIILEYVKNLGLTAKLKLIPEEVILKNPEIFSQFQVEEDPDNFDHIYSSQEMSTLEGSRFENKRYKVNLFKRNYYDVEIKLLNLTENKSKQYVLDVFNLWVKNKNQVLNEAMHEYIAIQNLLTHSDKFDLVCLGLWHKNQLIGFTITEVTHQKYAIFHFTKADSSYEGIFEYLYHKTAQELSKRGCMFLNREQDLGIPGLRTAKESWRPIKYLKKYIISHKN